GVKLIDSHPTVPQSRQPAGSRLTCGRKSSVQLTLRNRSVSDARRLVLAEKIGNLQPPVS
ncbi:MAG: hypothetical protein ACREXR_17645, partial [Gammaproteobacteria bacterium]